MVNRHLLVTAVPKGLLSLRTMKMKLWLKVFIGRLLLKLFVQNANETFYLIHSRNEV